MEEAAQLIVNDSRTVHNQLVEALGDAVKAKEQVMQECDKTLAMKNRVLSLLEEKTEILHDLSDARDLAEKMESRAGQLEMRVDKYFRVLQPGSDLSSMTLEELLRMQSAVNKNVQEAFADRMDVANRERDAALARAERLQETAGMVKCPCPTCDSVATESEVHVKMRCVPECDHLLCAKCFEEQLGNGRSTIFCYECLRYQPKPGLAPPAMPPHTVPMTGLYSPSPAPAAAEAVAQRLTTEDAFFTDPDAPFQTTAVEMSPPHA